MTDLRQAAQQALEALEHCCFSDALVTDKDVAADAIYTLRTALAQQQAEPVSMRMPKVGDKVICLEDESLGKVVSLTAGGSPDIKFDDGSHGTYLLREFAELFGYVAPPQRQWVGLTKVQQDDFADAYGSYEAVCAIEQALKERNA